MLHYESALTPPPSHREANWPTRKELLNTALFKNLLFAPKKKLKN